MDQFSVQRSGFRVKARKMALKSSQPRTQNAELELYGISAEKCCVGKVERLFLMWN